MTALASPQAHTRESQIERLRLKVRCLEFDIRCVRCASDSDRHVRALERSIREAEGLIEVGRFGAYVYINKKEAAYLHRGERAILEMPRVKQITVTEFGR